MKEDIEEAINNVGNTGSIQNQFSSAFAVTQLIVYVVPILILIILVILKIKNKVSIKKELPKLIINIGIIFIVNSIITVITNTYALSIDSESASEIPFIIGIIFNIVMLIINIFNTVKFLKNNKKEGKSKCQE